MNKSESKKYHFIYKITCLLNKKYYIGMHSTNNLEDNYLGGGTYLRRSIKKHGEQNFKKEILEYCESRETLAQREKEIVNADFLKDTNCMNLREGGFGGFTIEQQKENARRSNLKQQELRKDSEWVKRKSEKQSKVFKEQFASGQRERKYFFNWKDKNHTEETKLKQSEAKKGKYDGENNPSYGTCWITKEGVNKKIKKEELESFVSLGWIKGRKQYGHIV